MALYWIKTGRLIKMLFPRYLWNMPDDYVYLTFDDGPVPEATPWVLDVLKEYGAKATFFCIGNNVAANPDLFRRVLSEGHAVGNHTYNHLNGWRTEDAQYLADVRLFDRVAKKAADVTVKLFRPPYGKIKSSQANVLIQKGYKIVMWDVLSADFDQKISAEKCLQNVLRNLRPGSIIIFHDSVKANKNLKYALPATLEYLKEKGYKCEVLV